MTAPRYGVRHPGDAHVRPLPRPEVRAHVLRRLGRGVWRGHHRAAGFSHGDEPEQEKGQPTQEQLDKMKKQPCQMFAQGRCRYGDNCRYSHDPEAQNPDPKAEAKPKAKPKAKAEPKPAQPKIIKKSEVYEKHTVEGEVEINRTKKTREDGSAYWEIEYSDGSMMDVEIENP